MIQYQPCFVEPANTFPSNTRLSLLLDKIYVNSPQDPDTVLRHYGFDIQRPYRYKVGRDASQSWRTIRDALCRVRSFPDHDLYSAEAYQQLPYGSAAHKFDYVAPYIGQITEIRAANLMCAVLGWMSTELPDCIRHLAALTQSRGEGLLGNELILRFFGEYGNHNLLWEFERLFATTSIALRDQFIGSGMCLHAASYNWNGDDPYHTLFYVPGAPAAVAKALVAGMGVEYPPFAFEAEAHAAVLVRRAESIRYPEVGCFNERGEARNGMLHTAHDFIGEVVSHYRLRKLQALLA